MKLHRRRWSWHYQGVMAESWDSVRQKEFVESKGMYRATGKPMKCAQSGDCSGVGGVGKITEAKLLALWITDAHQLFGLYLLNGQDAEGFDKWLDEDVGVKRKDLRETIINSMQRLYARVFKAGWDGGV